MKEKLYSPKFSLTTSHTATIHLTDYKARPVNILPNKFNFDLIKYKSAPTIPIPLENVMLYSHLSRFANSGLNFNQQKQGQLSVRVPLERFSLVTNQTPKRARDISKAVKKSKPMLLRKAS